ncbi:MAG TPA: hypothetical protein VFL57_18285 [Bryobacteraceae bacterium]|nr:hypothetical protein [Bryobacteraceae bacterium]
MIIHTGEGEIALPSVARHRAATYRYRKLSEWLVDVLFALLLNFGQWVTSLAWGLRVGYQCFHDRRAAFARARIERPPVWMIDEETARLLQCPVGDSDCPRVR